MLPMASMGMSEPPAGTPEAKLRMEDDFDEQEERHRAEQERAVGREAAESRCGIAEAHEHLRIDVQQDTAEQEGQERLEGAGTSFW